MKLCVGEAFDGEDLLFVHRRRQNQAAVDRDIACAPVRSAANDHDGAGTALALGAALLRPRQPALAEQVEERDVGIEPWRVEGGAVDVQSKSLHRLSTVPRAVPLLQPTARHPTALHPTALHPTARHVRARWGS